METQQATIDEAVEAVLCGCINCISVPLSVLQLEVDMPIGGWDGLFEQLGIKQVTDHIGRRAVTAADARRLLNTVRRRAELAVEANARRSAKLAAKHPVPVSAGLPVVEGATPYESMVSAGVVTPSQEFGGGRPKPRFLEDELAEGQRFIDEQKRLAAERHKQRLADQMKEKLR